MLRLAWTICTGAIALTLLSLGGCVVPSYMARMDPGNAPRDGQVSQVVAIGSEQVQFTFRFKAGPDRKPIREDKREVTPWVDDRGQPIPVERDVPKPAESPGGVSVRISEVVINDTVGHKLSVIDQTVRREGNVYYVVVSSSAVTPDSYEVVCQIHLTVDQYQLKIASAATREVDRWRAAPKSFRFAVYGATESRPWWEFNLLGK
ncbi:MAG: hypothetical protein PHU85_09060 [Phycisphaerae bacterium]|nr:hypothetical protein [Phycisphaerae bacterium]